MGRVVVVGAGPAGSSAALILARQQAHEVLLLERRVLPRPKICAGGLSPWTLTWLRRMGLIRRVMAEACYIRGSTLHTGHGRPLVLRGPLWSAVLQRSRFDAILVDEARRAGARVRDGVRVVALSRHQTGLAVHTAQGDCLEASAVVLATGAGGRGLGCPRPPPGPFVGIMARFEGMEGINDHLEIFMDDEAVRPHYAWVFPEGPASANVGLCFRRRPGGPRAKELFGRFIDRHLERRLVHARQQGPTLTHPIDARFWPPTLEAGGMLLVGEAANLVDPWTGEGIHHALVSGQLAAEALAARAGVADAQARRLYVAGVRRRLVPLLLVSESLRRLACTPLFKICVRLVGLDPLASLLERAYGSLAPRQESRPPGNVKRSDG